MNRSSVSVRRRKSLSQNALISLFSSNSKVQLPHFPFKRPFGAEPPLEFSKLRKECPVSKVNIVDDKSWAWLLAKHVDICKVLSDNEHFSKVRTRPNFPELTKGGKLAAASHIPTFVDMDPPEHTRQRGMVSQRFAPEQVEMMVPMIQEITDHQIKEMMKETEA